ncbi:MAG TPA: YceI family protein, partial [Acidimicrobiales bacterium]|nr:YceI family protein [Acidimicrobiales bacterium]
MTNATAVANKVEGLEVPAPGIFSIDQSHSHVGFSVRHMMVSKVKGRFADFSGEITVSDDPLQSSVDVTINTA